MTNINEKILGDAGLSIEQSKIYLFLLEYGLSNAKTISSKTGIGRAFVYKILEQMEKDGFVEKKDIGKVALFFPAHPQKIKALAENAKDSSVIAFEGLNNIFGSLASNYNLLLGKPNVRFLEGIDGLKEMYADILDCGQDIKLLRSFLDHKNKEVATILRDHIEKQAAQGIRVKLIGPEREDVSAEELKGRDIERLITRKTIKEEFLMPSQIIIYGDKVSITDFQNIIITIIENQCVRDSFEKMFDFIWNHS